jgi:hypothetical protein
MKDHIYFHVALVYVRFRKCIFFFEVVYNMKLEVPQQRARYHLVEKKRKPTKAQPEFSAENTLFMISEGLLMKKKSKLR